MNKFPITAEISPSEIEQALRAATQPVLVESDEALRQAAESWESCPVLGIDTEFVRERTYRADLGLIQVSDGRTAWLLDPTRGLDLKPVERMLMDQRTVKVVHAASEDLEVLWNDLAVTPSPMFDTQIACAMTGQSLQLSYHGAVKWMLGLEVDKEQTRSNWLARPLSAQQLHYAATDVVFLPLVHSALEPGLRRLGRLEWHDEELQRLARLSRESTDPASAWLRISGAGQLEERSFEVLRRLAAWREITAKARNLARSFVIPDKVMLALATSRPRSLPELEQVSGLHPKAMRKFGEQLLRLIEAPADSVEPASQISTLDPKQRALLNRFRATVQEEAEKLGIDPGLLASRKMLEDLVRAREASGGPPEKMSGWRYSVITEALLAVAEEQA